MQLNELTALLPTT